MKNFIAISMILLLPGCASLGAAGAAGIGQAAAILSTVNAVYDGLVQAQTVSKLTADATQQLSNLDNLMSQFKAGQIQTKTDLNAAGQVVNEALAEYQRLKAPTQIADPGGLCQTRGN